MVWQIVSERVTDVIQVYLFNRTDEPRTATRPAELMDEWGLSTYSFSALILLTRAVPALTPSVMRSLQSLYFTPRRRVNRSTRLFNIGKMIPIHNELEYAIPLEMMCPDDDDKKNFERFNGGINHLDGTFRF